MKKTLALILAIVMVFALSVSAFAAEDLVGTVNTGNANDHTEGVASITDNEKTTNIAITATNGKVNNRYAVDIEYSALTFDIQGSNMTWDVNALKYVQTNDQATLPANKTFDLTITNRSDLPVNFTATINGKVADNVDGLTLALYEGHVEYVNSVLQTKDDSDNTAANIAAAATPTALTSGNTVTIAKATAGANGQNGTATKFPFALVASSAAWENVVAYYANEIAANGGTSAVVATLSVTIAAVPVQNG